MKHEQRHALPTYSYNRHRWLARLAANPGAPREGTRAVANQCRELGWTRYRRQKYGAITGSAAYGEELTETGRIQLALWNHEKGEV